jgi:hypothetical protein
VIELGMRELQVLDFDLENRPLSYLGNDWTSAEITAIGWSLVGEEKVHTLLLQADGTYLFDGKVSMPAKDALAHFRSRLEAADVVTGHYIIKHDLPILNGAFMELGIPPLGELLVQDTKLHLVRRKDLSASQENLASLFGLEEAKHHMTQTEWRTANRLTKAGLAASRKRVVDDVKQHKALRAELLKRGLLKAPSVWRS